MPCIVAYPCCSLRACTQLKRVEDGTSAALRTLQTVYTLVVAGLSVFVLSLVFNICVFFLMTGGGLVRCILWLRNLGVLPVKRGNEALP